jgi:pilus assembly protein Flp/PilA
MLAYLRKVKRNAEDRGASAVEYGLMVAGIAAVIVTFVFLLGGNIQSAFDTTNKSLCSAPGPGGIANCKTTPSP